MDLIMDSQMNNPKPCPFCGAGPNDIEVKPYDGGVLCHKCGAWMPSRVSTIPEESHGALEMWNTRKGCKNGNLP